MMADVIPTKRSTSGRKQWTLHDGPRGNGSLKRLRNQLANDGCPESQVVLAKQLLEEDAEIDKHAENARLGVYWLIKASQQGNREATDLLKQCLATGKGISEHNYLDVKRCIDMSQDEKVARKAAREMFANLSNGSEYITTIQLQRRMLTIDRCDHKIANEINANNTTTAPSNGELVNNYDMEDGGDSNDDSDWSERSNAMHNEKLTEDRLLDAAVCYTNGMLPKLNLSLHEPNARALDHLPFMQRSVRHPILLIRIMYYQLIQQFANFFNYINFGDMKMIYLLVIYALINTENFFYVIPMLLYYLTFIAMTAVTCQMLYDKVEFYDFRIWSGLFLTYSGGNLNSSEAELQFLKKNLRPFGHFFIALLINLITYPIINEQFIPQSELTILSFCMTFMTLHGFMYKRRDKLLIDYLILFSFSINVLAKYPYDTDPVVTQGWRFLDLNVPTFASYIIGNGIEFCINFRILLYAFIPVLFVKMALRENGRGIYKFLIPHCVTLSWLQIVIISSQGATMYGLIRGTLALVGVVLFLPLVGMTTVFLPAAALAKYLLLNNYFYTITLSVLFSLIGFSLTYFLGNTKFKAYINYLQLILAIAAIYFLLMGVVKYETNEEGNEVSLTYEEYKHMCHANGMSEKRAQTQIRCNHLNDVPIAWNGYVDQIRIKRIRNTYRQIIDKLPQPLANYLYCYYGKQMAHELRKFTKRACTLEAYDWYDFEMSVRMDEAHMLWGKKFEVMLDMTHQFVNFTMKLEANDRIWFKGELSGAGERLTAPRVQVNEIGCLTCQDTTLLTYKLSNDMMDYNRIMDDVMNGMKTILNFIFYPIIVFK